MKPLVALSLLLITRFSFADETRLDPPGSSLVRAKPTPVLGTCSTAKAPDAQILEVCEILQGRRTVEGSQLTPETLAAVQTAWDGALPLTSETRIGKGRLLLALRQRPADRSVPFLLSLLLRSTGDSETLLLDELLAYGEKSDEPVLQALQQAKEVVRVFGLARYVARRMRAGALRDRIEKLDSRAQREVFVALGSQAAQTLRGKEATLIALFKRQEEAAKYRLMRALMSYGGTPAVSELLSTIAKDETRLLRVRLSESLASGGPSELFTALLKDPDPRVREAALSSLSESEAPLADGMAKDVFALAERDLWYFVRSEAIETLRRKKSVDPFAKALTVRLKEEESPSVRETLRFALGLVEPAPKRPSDLNQLRPKLDPTLVSPGS